jgi:hypothetical protein
MFERELGRVHDERRSALLGDEFLPHAGFQRTHLRDIEAPPSRVWPWLVQIGARRAGWYSLDRLDNAGIRSADRIIPELQALQLGDLIPALPKGDAAFAVLRLEPARVLVLGSPSLRPGGAPEGADTSPYRYTWAFALEPIGDSATRLIVRGRASFVPSLGMALLRLYRGAAHEVMQRAQLRHLKHRIERPAPQLS